MHENEILDWNRLETVGCTENKSLHCPLGLRRPSAQRDSPIVSRRNIGRWWGTSILRAKSPEIGGACRLQTVGEACGHSAWVKIQWGINLVLTTYRS